MQDRSENYIGFHGLGEDYLQPSKRLATKKLSLSEALAHAHFARDVLTARDVLLCSFRSTARGVLISSYYTSRLLEIVTLLVLRF
jgi:hypothetical protein